MQHSKILYSKGILKNLKMLTQSQYSQIKFIAKLENVRLFCNTLKAINFVEDAVFQLSEDGFKAIVQESRCVQACVYVTKECFSEYKLPSDTTISFSVNLNVISDCLSIFFGTECSMKMLYKGNGAPLVLILEQHAEDDLVTECSIKTKNVEEPLEFALAENEEITSIILRGPDFSTLLNEIDKSCEELEIFVSPDAPYFRIKTIGVIQSEANVEVAKTSDMIITFTCKKISVARYKCSHIRLVMKSMMLASKVALRTDSTGLLGIQVMVIADKGSQIYIEYFITPLIEVQ